MRLASALATGVLASFLVGASSTAGCGEAGSTSAGVQAHGGGGIGVGSGPGGETAGKLRGRLTGFQETPAVSTTGSGEFRAFASEDGTTFTFELTYQDLEGHLVEGGVVTAAHIHFGQRNVAGGVSVHLCGTGGRPACPPPPATVTGTFTAANVVGPTAQGIDAGELDELLRAARAGLTYANVHTTRFPNGEIRGQLQASGFRGPDGEESE